MLQSNYGADFIVPTLPGPGDEVRWPLHNPDGAIEVDCPGLKHCFLQRGLLPNPEGDLIYALPVQITGRIRRSPWYVVGLDDLFHVLVPAHERDGVQIQETEYFFFP